MTTRAPAVLTNRKKKNKKRNQTNMSGLKQNKTNKQKKNKKRNQKNI